LRAQVARALYSESPLGVQPNGQVAQTIGDSRLIRLFEPVLGTPFARLERVVYAPVCPFVAIAVFHVAATHRA